MTSCFCRYAIVIIKCMVAMFAQGCQRDAIDPVRDCANRIADGGGYANLSDGAMYISWAYRSVGDTELDLVIECMAAGAVIETLDLEASSVRDRDLAKVGILKDLVKLDLGSTRIDGGLKYLAGLDRLKWLRLERTLVTSDGMKSVAKLPKLDTLLLCATTVGSDGLRHLADIPSLRVLLLTHRPLGEDELRAVSACSVEELHLSYTPLESKDLTPLTNMPALRALSLAHTKVDDESVDVFVKMAALESVDLSSSRVTNAGIQRLQELREDLQIDY